MFMLHCLRFSKKEIGEKLGMGDNARVTIHRWDKRLTNEDEVKLVQYKVNAQEKAQIIALIKEQTKDYANEASKKAQMTKQGKCIGEEWPPCSPDLNMVEIVWSLLTRRVAKGGWPTTVNALKDKIEEEWKKITQKEFQSMMLKYRRILKAILKAGGNRVARVMDY